MNWFAIPIAAAVAFVIGWIWYGPLFGTIWMKLTRTKQKDMKPEPLGMLIAYIRILITAVVLAWLLPLLGIVSISSAMTVAFWIWLGFTAATSLARVIWEFRPPMLWLIDNTYELIAVWLMAIIIVIW